MTEFFVGGDVNSQTQEGYTPLFIACFCNHLEIVRLLLSAKASVNLPASGIRLLQFNMATFPFAKFIEAFRNNLYYLQLAIFLVCCK